MLPDMTPAVARDVHAARREAARQECHSTQPLHLLLGLLEEEEGRASELLTRAGLDPAAVRHDHPAPAEGDILAPLSAAARSALVRARGVALEQAWERTVDSESLLVA